MQLSSIWLDYLNTRYITPDNLKIIYAESDFPAPTDTGDGNGTAIHLENGTEYLLNNDVSTAYTIVFPGEYGSAVLKSVGDIIYTLEYTGTGTAFTDSNSKFGFGGFNRINLSAPSGRLFDIQTDDENLEAYFFAEGCFVSDVDDIGIIGPYVETDTFFLSFADYNYGIRGYNNKYDFAHIYGEIESGKNPAPINKTITGVTQANPAVVTAVAHGFKNRDMICISSVSGMTEINDRCYIIDNITTDTFELNDVDSTGYTAYTSGGTSTKKAVQYSIFGNQGNVSVRLVGCETASNEKSLYIDSEANFEGVSLLGNVYTESADVFEDNSLTQKALKIKATGNVGLPDSSSNINATISSNAENTVIDAQSTPVPLNATLAVSNGTVERFKLYHRISYSSQTGNFTVGLTVTGGNSGASGTIIADTDNGATGELIIETDGATPFESGETITDTGTGSADLDWITPRFVYVGLDTALKQISGSIAIAPVSGAQQLMAVYFSKNGVIDETSEVFAKSAQDDYESLPLHGAYQMTTDDYIEILVENETSDIDINNETVNILIH